MNIMTVKELRALLNDPAINENSAVIPVITAVEGLSETAVTEVNNFIKASSQRLFGMCRLGIIFISDMSKLAPDTLDTATSDIVYLTHN